MKYISLVARLIIATPFIGLFLYFHTLNAEGVRKQNSTGAFVAVKATVIESRVQRITTSDRVYYEPKIVYAYEVDGNKYKSDRLGFGGARPGARNAGNKPHKYVLEYPVGRVIEAYFNPEKPGEAVLTRKQITNSAISYFILGLGGLFLLIILGPWVVRYLL